MRIAVLLLGLAALSACRREVTDVDRLELVWGRRGVSTGRMQKPRAMAIDARDELYIVDMTGRIQVFDADGKYLRGWSTPVCTNGRPTGLSIDRDGNLAVADTHYFRVLFYTPQGELLTERTLGGVCGHGPGEFYFVTDVAQDREGNYYVSEYGDYDRVQKFTRDGRFVMQWGQHGQAPGEFVRPQSLDIDDEGRIWVADACNHRVQVFEIHGDTAKLVRIWGEQGSAVGQLTYPYGLQLDRRGHVYVSEFGNNRVQKFTLAGESVGVWGVAGKRPGELYQPWTLALDSRGRLHVLDSNNHRVQRVRL